MSDGTAASLVAQDNGTSRPTGKTLKFAIGMTLIGAGVLVTPVWCFALLWGALNLLGVW